MKVKKGDTVKILSGKDRGKTGKIARVFLGEGRVLVEGVNLKKRHRRSSRQDKKGEMVLKPGPLAASLVALVCSRCNKSTRAGYMVDDGGKKSRVCKKCGQKI